MHFPEDVILSWILPKRRCRGCVRRFSTGGVRIQPYKRDTSVSKFSSEYASLFFF